MADVDDQKRAEIVLDRTAVFDPSLKAGFRQTIGLRKTHPQADMRIFY